MHKSSKTLFLEFSFALKSELNWIRRSNPSNIKDAIETKKKDNAGEYTLLLHSLLSLRQTFFPIAESHHSLELNPSHIKRGDRNKEKRQCAQVYIPTSSHPSLPSANLFPNIFFTKTHQNSYSKDTISKNDFLPSYFSRE